MRKIGLLMMVGLLLVLGGCALFTTNIVEVSYTITFNTMGGESMDEIIIDSNFAPNLEVDKIPNKEGYEFKGWFYDVGLTKRFNQDQKLNQDLILYAKWQILFYEVSFTNIFSNYSVTQTIAYGNKAVFEPFIRYGYTLVYYYETDESIPFDFDTAIKKDYDLFTKWEFNEAYMRISFESNGGSDISEVIIPKDSLITKPQNPTKDLFVFAGWYINSDFTTVFDFSQTVANDMTLYAKWVEPLEKDYEINEDTLSWNHISGILFYDVYIGEDSVDPITTTSNFIDLSPYESQLIEETLIEVYVVYETLKSYILFDVVVIYEDNAILYETGFESAKFTTSTTYNNNTVPKHLGEDNFKWFIINGAVSSTTPLVGEKSVQLRWYTATTKMPYLEMDFSLQGVKKLNFKAKSLDHDLKVSYKVDGILNSHVETFDLNANLSTYEVIINQEGLVSIRFELVKVSNYSGKQVYIDDITVYGFSEDRSLIEVVETINLPDESDLLALKQTFETDRSNLGAPGFSMLSSEGLNNYYASLNGLTDNAFKLKLQQIITQSHERLISYGEARFVLEKADLVISESYAYLNGIYSEHQIVRYWDGGNTWSREHVWPNSRLAMQRVSNSDKNQGSDVHNLRAINPSVNSSRSNRYFTNGSAFGIVGSDMYYPGDTYKGDVARILFYMATRYANILTLRNTNIIDSAYTSEGAVMGILDELLQWHIDDPVDQFEINRNNVIYSYQGNRNPFIDRPEYVNVYFS